VVLQKFNGELVLLDSRESGAGGGGRSDYGDQDFGGGQRQQSRPQPATFDTDLDDDVPF
jgi:single-strand DNA-binding protein